MEKEEKRGGGLKRIGDIIQRSTVITVKSTTNHPEQSLTPKYEQTTTLTKGTPQKLPQKPYKAYGNEKLIAVVKEIEEEFGDIRHERENIGQVHNILKIVNARGWTDSTLIDMMKRAAGLTREKEGSFTTSKMAYFFSVLRREYGLPPP